MNGGAVKRSSPIVCIDTRWALRGVSYHLGEFPFRAAIRSLDGRRANGSVSKESVRVQAHIASTREASSLYTLTPTCHARDS
jgi:hypothetical protein